MKKIFGDKRVLVTGATGLIGSHLVNELINLGAYVVTYGRNEDKIRETFCEHIEKDNFNFEIGDISTGLQENIGEFDFIFHAASPIAGSEIKENPVDVISANLVGTTSCLEYLKNQRSNAGKRGRLVVFSSATVYGNCINEDMNVTEAETTISDSLDAANSPYSESKRMIEVLAKSYVKQYDVDSVIVRIGWVYGYTKKQPNTAFYEFINNAIAGQDICMNNSGMSRRDNIYIDDVVSGILTVAAKGERGESYNISSNNDKDNFKAIDEIAQIIALKANEILDANITVKFKQISDTRKPGVRMDNQKTKALGWSINTSIYEGIEKTIRYYKV